MIYLKEEREIFLMAEGGKLLAGIMKELERKVEPGVTTNYLNEIAKNLIKRAKAKPSFLGYEGFPAVLCTSLNEVIVHGLPSERVLKEGDIISLDLGIFYKGFHTDMAITLGVGKISKEAEKLIKTTKKALEIGIEKVKIGNNFGDLGKTIQDFVESQGFNVVRELCGHGIGRNLHEDPKVLNYYDKETANLEIKEGMVFCLEPMITLGDWRLEKSADGHGFKTKDNSLSAHFEHTLAVTKKGCLVLTALDDF